MAGLKQSEIMRLVNRYIGVEGGYLKDFSYNSHIEFYPEYCDLDINPFDYEGHTTRYRFLDVLQKVDAPTQAAIIRGVLKKCPPDPNVFQTRTKELHEEFLEIAKRLEGAAPIASPSLKITTAVVERAIADAEALITTQGATSGIDRLHTALHGYLKAVCTEAGLIYPESATIAALFKVLREQHPVVSAQGSRSQDITQVFKAMSSIMDVLNPIRNNASVAHPNAELLERHEAMLVVNITRTILHYLDSKLADNPK